MRILISLCLFWMSAALWHAASAQASDAEMSAASAELVSAPSVQARDRLYGLLSAQSGPPSVESVSAFISLLAFDQRQEDHTNLFNSASAAATHFEPAAEIITKPYLEARFLQAVARFNLERAPNAMIEMAHVEGQARAFQTHIGEQPQWAIDLKWSADAWGMAMNAYFESEKEAHPSDEEIQAVLALYGTDIAARNARAARSLDENGLPFCAGRMIQRPAMRFPRVQNMRDLFGAVIVSFDLDGEGNVLNPVVLASVPIATFDEDTVSTVQKWRFRPDRPRDVGQVCRLNRSSIVQPLVFQLR